MKKILLVLPIFFVAGLILITAPAHAADSLDAIPLPTSDALILKQALDILKILLDELSARIDSGDQIILANAGVVSASLAEIQGGLLSLDNTLIAFGGDGRAITREPASPILPLLEQSEASMQGVPVSKENPVAQTAPGKITEAAPAPFQSTLPTQGITPTYSVPPNNGQAALAAGQFDLGKFVWPGIIIIAAFAAIWWFRAKDKKDELAVAKSGSKKAIPAAVAIKDLPPPIENSGIEFY